MTRHIAGKLPGKHLLTVTRTAALARHKDFLYVGYADLGWGTTLVDIGRCTKSNCLGSRLVSTAKWRNGIDPLLRVTAGQSISYRVIPLEARRERLLQAVFALLYKRLPVMNGAAGRRRKSAGGGLGAGQFTFKFDLADLDDDTRTEIEQMFPRSAGCRKLMNVLVKLHEEGVRTLNLCFGKKRGRKSKAAVVTHRSPKLLTRPILWEGTRYQSPKALLDHVQSSGRQP